MINKKPISNNIITDEVQVVNKIKETNKVQHHNELIKSFSRLDKVPLKIFEIAISCIDYKNPPKDNTIYIDKQEIFKMFKAEDTNKYTRFKEHMKKFQQQSLETNINNEVELITIAPYLKWSIKEEKNLVKIKFSEEIMPYLLEIKGSFTQYQLKETLNLESKHSIVVFKWLIMNYNQYDKYKKTGERTKKQLYDYKNPIISIKDLRKLTNTTKEYELFINLDKRVIKNSINEINKKTSLNVSYEKIKKGRNIDSIQFFLEKKKEKTYLKLSDVVDEESMMEYEKQQEEFEEKRRTEILNSEDDQKIYIEAMQNIYIQKMINSQLLYMGSIEGVCLAYKRIVPIYEEIEKKYKGKAKNKDWFMYHSAYVKETFDNKKSEKEKISYLIDAALSYLEVVEAGKAY